tara:strand:+ start:52 stop:456 length:405 start_codon:yes stop_codon:yes gene_type:complete
MAKISKWFAHEEFACTCGCKTLFEVDKKILHALDKARDKCGPLIVSSGHRCTEKNKAVGGAQASWHLLRDGVLHAADVVLAKRSDRTFRNTLKLYVALDGAHVQGAGLYPSWVHCDFRKYQRSRWVDKRVDWDE